MRTQVRTLAIAVAVVFGVTAIALGDSALFGRLGDTGMIASAYAKDEGGSPGHTTGGSSGGSSHTGGSSSHATGGGSTGGHASGGSSHTGGSSSHSTGGGETGGHTTGGHATGGGASGGHTTGGHETGASGGPSTTSHRYGLERADHGTKPGHEGHASGVHGQNAWHGGHSGSTHVTGSDRRFGGGSGLSGLDTVPEGPARFADNTTLTRTASAVPGPKFQFRYWGGWVIPDTGGTNDGGTVTPATYDVEPVDTIPIGGGGGPLARTTLPSAARCDGVGPNMSTRAFTSTQNLVRLDAARTEVDPEAIGSGRGVDPSMMIAVQEALVDGRADAMLVGAYLGMMSRTTVTPETVKRVAYRLCAPVTDEIASNVAQIAEEVRMTARVD